MQAREHGLRNPRRVLDTPATERVDEHALDALAHCRRVALTRNEHEAREEAAEQVPAHEQPNPLALLELEDAQRGAQELVRRHLEQLVARVGLERLLEILAGVAVGREPGVPDHVPAPLPEDRDHTWALVVRTRRVEAEEPVLAHDLAVGAEATHADVVEERRAVHGGP